MALGFLTVVVMLFLSVFDSAAAEWFSPDYMRTFLCEIDAGSNNFCNLSYESLSNVFLSKRREWFKNAEVEISKKKAQLSNKDIYLWNAPERINYPLIKRSIEYNWSAAYRQRMQYGMNVDKTIELLKLAEEFQARLENDYDLMYDIDKYHQLLTLPGFAGKMYWVGEKTFWNSNFEKAKNVFSFFLLPENKDGFVRGASHFFLGRTLISSLESSNDDQLKSFNKEALSHFLKVPTYPTCLTYISYAYIAAATSAELLGDRRTAVALAFVDVPSIDHDTFAGLRHTVAASASKGLRDFTNCVKHLQSAISYDASHEETAKFVMENIPSTYKSDDFWNYCATNRLNMIDRHNAVAAALTNEFLEADFNELYEALTIKWPETDELPDSIMTNRVLNNNFFHPAKEKQYENLKTNRKQRNGAKR